MKFLYINFITFLLIACKQQKTISTNNPNTYQETYKLYYDSLELNAEYWRVNKENNKEYELLNEKNAFSSSFYFNKNKILKNKNIKIYIKGKINVEDENTNFLVVHTIKDGEDLKLWKGNKINISKTNVWVDFIDSIIIPALVTDEYNYQNYIWAANNQNAKLKDLKIEIKEHIFDTYIADIKIPTLIDTLFKNLPIINVFLSYNGNTFPF
jgi:hypothetical protein